MRPESRETMRAAGKVVWLKALPETILRRMSGDETTAARRPDLTDKGPLDEIVHLLEKREPVYRRTCHLEIDTEGREPEAIAAEILDRLDLTPDAGDPA
jgi:shikimate kinase